MINLYKFISDSVTLRPTSMFTGDIDANWEKRKEGISSK